jgi:hypothetical protein
MPPGTVPNPISTRASANRRNAQEFRETARLTTNEDSFGSTIPLKQPNVLCVGFQNIGGFPLDKTKQKEDIIRSGITSWSFDIFGVAETNLDWRMVPEDHKLHARTKEWWPSLHLSYSFNHTQPPSTPTQYGGTALFSIDKAAHRIIEKGQDPTGLGRWCWSRYRGKSSHTLRVFSAYRPNPPQGPMSVYAQHSLHLRSQADQRCPRLAFLEDLTLQVAESKETGDMIIILLDGNTNMKESDLTQVFTSLSLREVLLT